MIERGVGDVRFTNESSPLFQSAISGLELSFEASEPPGFSGISHESTAPRSV
jgi:hypothetical protein